MDRFLENILKGISIYEKAYSDCQTALKNKGKIEKQTGFKADKLDLNLAKLITKVINDISIGYSFSDFLKSVETFSKNTDKFKTVAGDLLTIKDLVDKGVVRRETFVYLVLHLYSSNFDNFVNLLEPLSKSIQKEKRYEYKLKKSGEVRQYRVHNAETILKILELFEPTIKKSLEKLFNRDLRNKVSHEDYSVKGKTILYGDNTIHMDEVLKTTVNFGELINQIQCFEYKNRLIMYKEIKKRGMTENEAKDFESDFKTS